VRGGGLAGQEQRAVDGFSEEEQALPVAAEGEVALRGRGIEKELCGLAHESILLSSGGAGWSGSFRVLYRPAVRMLGQNFGFSWVILETRPESPLLPTGSSTAGRDRRPGHSPRSASTRVPGRRVPGRGTAEPVSPPRYLRHSLVVGAYPAASGCNSTGSNRANDLRVSPIAMLE
jgi:hypothetical protein